MSEAQAIAPEETETPKSESGLLLDSLEIENFRCFRHLTIPKLGRVNLITGKNNVGKSTLLEALYSASRQKKLNALRSVLSYRQETPGSLHMQKEKQKSDLLDLYNIFPFVSNIFYGRDFNTVGSFSVSSNKNSIRFLIMPRDSDKKDGEISVDFARKNGFYVSAIQSDKILEVQHLEDFLVDYQSDNRGVDPTQMIRINGIVGTPIDSIWDEISLTNREDLVIDYLKYFIPDLERIGFRNSEYESMRKPYAKLKGVDVPVPLRNFGDGANKIFHISMSLSSCQNGLCLIDEIDSGMHYSILKDIFRFIFRIASLYNIQVVCTTHSWECIEAFQQVSLEDNDPKSGMLIRLQNRDGNIVATNFDEDGLEVMTRHGLEVR